MTYFQSRYAFVHHSADAFYSLKARQLFKFLNAFGMNGARSFLDLGCGCADLAHAVRQDFGFSVGGIEQDAEMVAKAREKGAGDFFVGDVLNPAEGLDHRFDVVGSFELFEHLKHDDHARAFEMYRRYASKDGIGVIMVPNAGHPLLGGWLAFSDYTHQSFFTPESLAQFLRLQGVKDARIFPWYLGGSEKLIRVRGVLGKCLGRLTKVLIAAFSTVPGQTDPFVVDPFPFSSHLIAVFKIPS